jgi:tetratricopeptide (TPR) repeat protein
MKLKNPIISICLIILVQLPAEILFSQNAQAKPTRQSSTEAFSQGNYEKAYAQFSELLLIYPKDPLYKYYSGVSLVKLNRDPAEAAMLLKEAVSGAGSLKSLPSDGLFYLGRANQMAGNYSEAIEAYNSFTSHAGKKTAREMGVPELISQCSQQTGKPAEPSVAAAQVLSSSKPVEAVQKPAEILPGPQIQMGQESEQVLNAAIAYQLKADSVTSMVNSQKNKMESLPLSQRSSAKVAIAENEKVAAGFQASADKKYQEARDLTNHAATTSAPETGKTIVISQMSVAEPATGPASVSKAYAVQDTAKRPMIGIFSFFDATGKPVTDPKAKVAVDPPVPAGLIYRIQIGVFKNPVLPSYFRGLSPVYGFKVEGTEKIIYYIGMFRKSADASKALSSVKAKGFRDAFTVPLSDSKRVSSDRAASLEKEWGTKPFYSVEKSMSKSEADTVTQTLSFRVELSRSPVPLAYDAVEEIKKLAGNKGMDIILLQTGEYSYLIGKFITFESASEYADLLKRNGYRDAQVAAWLGRKEIPIETAKQLFEKLQ